MRRERERGRTDAMCVRQTDRQTDRRTESFRVLYLHIFSNKLVYKKVPLFVNFDIRELDVSSLVSTH